MPARRLACLPPLLAALIFAGSALAQTTAPATPTVTPAPNCEKPGVYPSANTSTQLASESEAKRNRWVSKAKVYLDCMKTFIDEQQAAAAPHIKAANAAAEEYNEAAKSFNEQMGAAQRQ